MASAKWWQYNRLLVIDNIYIDILVAILDIYHEDGHRLKIDSKLYSLAAKAYRHQDDHFTIHRTEKVARSGFCPWVAWIIAAIIAAEKANWVERSSGKISSRSQVLSNRAKKHFPDIARFLTCSTRLVWELLSGSTGRLLVHINRDSSEVWIPALQKDRADHCHVNKAKCGWFLSSDYEVLFLPHRQVLRSIWIRAIL